MSKIIVFGTGLFFLRRKEMLPHDAVICGFIDNNEEKQGKYLDGRKIYNPLDVASLEYDYIVLASMKPNEMKYQLLSIGVPVYKIKYWEEYVAINSHSTLIKYSSNITFTEKPERVLIIVPTMNFAGGFMTALNFGIIMKLKGYEVVIASPVYDENVAKYVLKKEMDVWICPSIPYIEETELLWMNEFDYVLCNSLQTIVCACKIIPIKKLIFWLHEHSGQYKDILTQYSGLYDLKRLEKINIFAVSEQAKKNFINNIKIKSDYVEILPLGVEDCLHKGKCGILKSMDRPIVISMVANISPLKNQLQLVNAIKMLPDNLRKRIICKFIGRDVNSNYRKELEEAIKNQYGFEICGEYSQSEVREALYSIDIIACVSTEETMSMSIVEGLMHGKICITNDNTGVAKFISDGINGFVYRANNFESLVEKIKYIVENFTTLDCISYSARRLYMREFSMKKFEKRLNSILV